MLSKVFLTAASKNFGSFTRPNNIDQSQNKKKKVDKKIKKTANSGDLLGNMQLKLSFYDWCISILSSKKCQTPIILADLLGNESLLQRVQKVVVCDLWLVDFDPFCEFLGFKVRCLWFYCDQNRARAPQTFASLCLFTCLVYVSTYCVPIAHLRQNKPFSLLYLGHAQITINF